MSNQLITIPQFISAQLMEIIPGSDIDKNLQFLIANGFMWDCTVHKIALVQNNEIKFHMFKDHIHSPHKPFAQTIDRFINLSFENQTHDRQQKIEETLPKENKLISIEDAPAELMDQLHVEALAILFQLEFVWSQTHHRFELYEDESDEALIMIGHQQTIGNTGLQYIKDVNAELLAKKVLANLDQELVSELQLTLVSAYCMSKGFHQLDILNVNVRALNHAGYFYSQTKDMFVKVICGEHELPTSILRKEDIKEFLQ